MNRDGRRAGLGGVLFAASLAVGFTLFGPKGGQYSAAEVAAFVAQGATALIVSVYLLVVSIIGLWVLTSHLADSWLGADGQGRVARGASLAAGTAFLVGWGLYLGVPASVLGGGPAIDPGITYAFISGGMLVFFGAGGMLLGIALITLATGAGSAPGWIRAFTALAGLAALSSWAFLLATGLSPNQWLPGPFYVVILWGLAIGIWLLVSPVARVDRRMRLTRHALALTMVVLAGCAGQPSGSPVPSLGPVRSLLVDTDVAPDDLVALAFLIQSPAVEIAAITVSGTGEAHCAGGMDVALRLLERLEAPMIPVACGRETPLGGDHAFPDAWRVGADSGSDLDLPATERKPFDGTAVELIADTAEAVGELRILTLGPLTNLADALMSEPTLADQIESIYTMGGAVFAPGNVAFGGPPENQVAEWNIYVDPRAAQTVIGSGAVVRLISLDGTNQVPVTTEYAQRVLGEATSLAAKVMAELFAEHAYMTDGSYYLWDPLAAALAAGYPIGSFSPARVEVEEAEGPEVGFTRPIDGTPNVEYLSSADAGAAQDILLDTLNSTADEH